MVRIFFSISFWASSIMQNFSVLVFESSVLSWRSSSTHLDDSIVFISSWAIRSLNVDKACEV